MSATNESRSEPASLTGRLLLYRQPELLNREEHGALGLRQPQRPFDFARRTSVLPLTLAELPAAQMYYPIVFVGATNPIPFAVVGAADEANLFVDEHGQWAANTYIPAYVRCYPFALASRTDEKFAVVIDRDAENICEDAPQPFFDGNELTAEVQSLVDFCARYDAERRRTLEFGRRISEFELLTAHEARQPQASGEPIPIASYLAVDQEKFNKLGPDALEKLFANGFLAGIFAHLFSLGNWQRLIDMLGPDALKE